MMPKRTIGNHSLQFLSPVDRVVEAFYEIVPGMLVKHNVMARYRFGIVVSMDSDSDYNGSYDGITCMVLWSSS